ncbi:MAG: hypothetical protein ITG00_10765 [Flavobacterium sp.]|nr:hypothetical protein [Flavobacterium sp.]
MNKSLLLLCLITFSGAFAQTPATQQEIATMVASESVFVHINANALVPGESLYYKMYCRSSMQNAVSSKVGYVELVGRDHKTVFSHKLFLNDGIAYGDFFVTPSIPTGNYKLIGYTNAILNNPERIFAIDITIVNPFQVSGEVSSNTNVAAVPTVKAPTKSYELLGNKKAFATREKISLNLASLLQQYPNGQFSASVRKNNRLAPLPVMSAAQYVQTNTNFETAVKPITILPEWRGEIVSGRIAGAQAKLPVALSVPGKSFAFKVANTDTSGNYTFTVNNPHYQNDVFVQVINGENGQYEVQPGQRPLPDYANFDFQNYFPGRELEEAIREQSIAAQIQNSYYIHNADTLAATPRLKSFYEPGAKRFVLNDYTRFPTFAETIVEVIEGAYYQQKDGQYSLHVRDNNLGRTIPEPTLVLVDGLMVQNPNDLFKYPAAGIEQISTHSGIYLYGPTAFNGVISVVTKNQDFISSDKTIVRQNIQRPVPVKKYFRKNHDDSELDLKIPDYRYQLLWMPEINENELTFYASDVNGSYEITIEGFTANGMPVSIRDSFEVK